MLAKCPNVNLNDQNELKPAFEVETMSSNVKRECGF